MTNLFLFFNHTFTGKQEQEARTSLFVQNIIRPPDPIQALWGQVPPDSEKLRPFMRPILSWLDQYGRKGDFVLVQGDFGACFLLVQHALQRGYTPIYSTTERKAVEKKLDNGKIALTHIFSHIRFRKYNQ